MELNQNRIVPEINLDQYDYDLPKDRIADYPLEDRSKSKLLCLNRRTQELKHEVFFNLPNLIPNESLLIFNNTKVIAARLNMFKDTGGNAELLCIEPTGVTRDPQIAMAHKHETSWICIVGGKNINEGKVLHSSKDLLKAKILKRFDNKALVRFSWDTHDSFAQIIELIGSVPLPPYIKRQPIETDKVRYQTVYANFDGSVAAPTAGLHFTEDIINQLSLRGNTIANVTLHVGPGTFKPIDSENIFNHDMHKEMISVEKAEIIKILDHMESKANNKIIAVGTTSVRTVETLFWLGVKIHNGEEMDILHNEIIFEQWTPYRLMSKYGITGATTSFRALIEYMEKNSLNRINARTKLFIVPGYNFGVISGIITNYHLPKSTLILLVAAFLGNDLWKKAYREALNNDYRFLSYGDSSLLL